MSCQQLCTRCMQVIQQIPMSRLTKAVLGGFGACIGFSKVVSRTTEASCAQLASVSNMAPPILAAVIFSKRHK